MTLPDVIKGMNRAFSVDDVLDQAPDARKATVYQTLWRMARDEQIVSVAQGVYATQERVGEIAQLALPDPDDALVTRFLQVEAAIGARVSDRRLAARIMELIRSAMIVE